MRIYLLLLIPLLLSGCLDSFTSERVAENQYTAGDYVIEETIDREDGFPDATFERVYRVNNGRFNTTLGSYSDESSTGITIPPEIVDGWLVVYSSSHLFLWQPDKEAIQIDPYVVEGWVEYADQFSFALNGHYDYQAAQFWVENGRWFIEYTCTYCLDNRPATLLFTSDDEGAHVRFVDGDY